MAGNDFKRPEFNRRDNNRRDNRKRFDRRSEKPRSEVKEVIWVPKTKLGRDVVAGKYSSMDEVILSGQKIMEMEITEKLLPGLATDFVNVGQAKGKFGGGKRKSSKPTQKKTSEGNKMSFCMICLSGNHEGIVGLGFGKARETVPAREKAIRDAKTNLIVVRRGCGEWNCFCGSAHSIPFAVVGKSGSAKVVLRPAPKGTGLSAEGELRKMLQLAGIKDVWSKTYGTVKNKVNLMKAGFDALKKLQNVKVKPDVVLGRGMKEGSKDEQF